MIVTNIWQKLSSVELKVVLIVTSQMTTRATFPVRLKCIRMLLLSFFSNEQEDSTPAVEPAHLLVAISLEGETLRRRRFWQRE